MRLIIFGVSNIVGHIFDCAQALGFTPSAIVLNTPEVVRPRTKSIYDRIKLLDQPPRVIQMDQFSPQDGECYFLGTTAAGREELAEEVRTRFGIRFCTLLHPAAWLSPHCTIADGVYVSAHSSIGPGAEIGEHVFVGAKVHIGHDTVVGPYSRLLSGCNVAGHVQVGYGVTVGMGATIIEELEIGPEAFIAAGAVVIKDLPARVMAAGVPARYRKSLNVAGIAKRNVISARHD